MIRRLVSLLSLTVLVPLAEAAVPRVYSVSTANDKPMFVRPGGTSFTWSFDSTVSQVGYAGANLGSTFNRGRIEYSSNGGSSWTTYPYSSGDYVYVTAAGKIWRFVDTSPGNTTSTDSFHIAVLLPAGGSQTGGAFAMPDNAPTDITSSTPVVFNDTANGGTVATLTPADTGASAGGIWVLESQSHANVFTLTSDTTTNNIATLLRGSGTLPAIGQTVTATVRYYDMYQTDTSGAAISGQGYAKTLTYTVVQDSTTDLVGLGSEFSTNTVTTGAQNAPVIARLTTGNYVVVWRSIAQDSDIGSNGGIYARIFNATGVAQTAEIRISPLDNVNQLAPAVAALSGGRYVVTYQDASNANDVIFRIIAADNTVGTATSVDSTASLSQSAPRVATLSNGNFAIAWASNASNADVAARVFDGTTGATVGSQLTINTTTAGIQSQVDVAALANGDYVVTWRDSNVNSGDIMAQRVSGNALAGSELTVATGPLSQNTARVAGFGDGTFVVTWADFGVEGESDSEGNIYFRRYTAAGATTGSVTRANVGTLGNQFQPAIAGFSDGGFVIAWTTAYYDGDQSGVFGRRFDSTGTAIDATDFLVNEKRRNSQNAPALATGPSGAFAAAWVDTGQEGSGNAGVEARMYSPGPVNVAPTFAGVTTTLSVNQNASATSIVGLLHVSDTDTSQTLTWTQSTAPTHGTLSLSFATAASGSTDITPGGTITYTPTSGYAGSDSFTVQVSDGTATATRTITVTVNDVTPPTVVSVVRTAAQTLTPGATSVVFRVTYSEPVTGVVSGNFQVEALGGGNIVASATGVSAVSSSVYDVTVTITSGSGEFRLNVVN